MIPLVERFPGLAAVPRARLVGAPTPVTRLEGLSENLWLKRDDLCASPMGGNKTRALEFLLGARRTGDRVVTVGSAGSTHVLAVATFGARLGLTVSAGRWRQEMNDSARRITDRTARSGARSPVFRTVAAAYAWAWTQRLRGGAWIAAGGSTPLGVLGHLNAGLELVGQIDAGLLPQPARVVVPLGTGGTAAGLALAFAIAERDITVVGVRVVPRLVANARHVRALARRTARLIERVAKVPVPRLRHDSVVVMHEAFGGAYGRETENARRAAERLRANTGIVLDGTYSAKAFAEALALAGDAPSLFWLTFDSRTLDGSAR